MLLAERALAIPAAEDGSPPVNTARVLQRCKTCLEVGEVRGRPASLSQVRAWVEHPFHIVKNLFRHKRLRYVIV